LPFWTTRFPADERVGRISWLPLDQHSSVWFISTSGQEWETKPRGRQRQNRNYTVAQILLYYVYQKNCIERLNKQKRVKNKNKN
jgi:hypothetical protein